MIMLVVHSDIRPYEKSGRIQFLVRRRQNLIC